MKQEEKIGYGLMTLKDKKEFRLDGVKNVLSFEESTVTLETELGNLCIEGEDLKIESLYGEGGEILIKGLINGIYYYEKKSSGGFLKGLFK